MAVVLYAQRLVPQRAELLLVQLSVFVQTERCVSPPFRSTHHRLNNHQNFNHMLQYLLGYLVAIIKTIHCISHSAKLDLAVLKISCSRPLLLPCSTPPDGPISKTLKICAKIELCAQIFQLPYIVNDRLVLLILHSIRFTVSCMSQMRPLDIVAVQADGGNRLVSASVS